MNTDLILEENLERYARYDALTAQQIGEVDVSSYEFCRTHKGELNLRCKQKGKELYYHSINGAVEEALSIFNKMALGTNKVLFIYGVGLGYYYEAIKKWLHEDKSRYLIFIEDDLAVLHRLFETEKGTRLLKDPQVIIQYFFRKDEQFTNEFQDRMSRVIRGFARSFCFLSSLSLYATTRGNICEIIRKQLFFGITVQAIEYGEMAHYMSLLYANYYSNTTQLFRTSIAPLTFGMFNQVPMVVVGAGPSLIKDIERIRRLQNKALIVASGTAMNVLNKHGIFPHLGGAIDPTSSQFSRLRTNFAFEIPYFFRPRVSYHALRTLHGPKVYTNGFSNYLISRWFEERLGIYTEKPFFTGISTTNYCLALGANFAANPLLFVGIDLSYTDAERYPKGVTAHPIDSRIEHQHLTKRNWATLGGVGIDGKVVETKMEWLIEGQFITQLKQLYEGTTFINCTDRGMKVANVENMSLEEAENRYLKESVEVLDHIHAVIQNAATPWVTKEKIIAVFNELLTTLNRCIEIIDQLKEEINCLWARCEKGEPLPQIRPYSGLQALLETELKETEGYRCLLQDFNYVIETMAIAKEHQVKCHPELFTEKSLQLQKLEIEVNYYAYYQSVARDQMQLIKEVLEKFEREEAILSKLNPPPPIPQQEEEPVDVTWVDVKVPESARHMAIPPNVPYAEIALFKDKKKHGECLWVYPEGEVFSLRYYSQGKLHGPLKFFSKSGILLSSAFFVEGEREGKSQQYYHTGTLYSVLRHRQGKWHGMQEYYFENGYLKSLIPFIDGSLHGKVLLYYENGQKKRELHFHQGALEGVEYGWSVAGTLTLEAHYRAGEPVGTSKMWHSNGILARQVTYHEDSTHVDLYEWDTAGELINKELVVPTNEYEEKIAKEKRMVSALAAFEKELSQISSNCRE